MTPETEPFWYGVAVIAVLGGLCAAWLLALMILDGMGWKLRIRRGK